jgi:hypothetical protein
MSTSQPATSQFELAIGELLASKEEQLDFIC